MGPNCENNPPSLTLHPVERFASGEIAYKLNGSTSEGNFVWYQKIGEGGDAYTSLTKAKDNTVYYVPGYLCDGVTADGKMHYSNNGGRYVADHTEATDAAVAATCTETGLTEGKHCSICYTVLVEQVETEPLGHAWGEYHLNGDQTCTYDGHKTAECTREGCSEENKIVATGAALGHLFTEYLSNGDATTEADGHKTAECDRGCGATDTVIDEGSRIIETPTGITNVESGHSHKAVKVIENGRVVIIRDGVKYDLAGRKL